MDSFLWRRSTGVAGLSMGSLLVAVACGGAGDHGFFERAPNAGRGGTTGVGASGGAAGTSVAGSGGSVGGASGNAGSTSGGAAGSGSGNGSGGDGATGGAVAGSAGVGAGGVALGGSGGATAGVSGEGGMGEGGAPPVDCSGHDATARDFDGHCYLFRAGERTWDEAVDDCEGRGAHLVTISSEGRDRAGFEAENRFVWELGGMVPVWIGATDGKGPLQAGDGTFFTWITGEPMTFHAWSGGQPNNAQASCSEGTECSCAQGACYEHCGFQWANAAADPTTVPGWNDRLCEHRIAHVCEWDEE